MRIGMGIGMAMVALAAVACSKTDADKAAADSQAIAAAPRFTIADFGQLRYLEGRWKGAMPNGNAFYESYHFVNDSTILKGGHTDSTFKTKSDSSLIVFRNGVVIDSGSSVYTAEKLDATVVDFRASPTYHFTWTRESADAWTARLFSKQPDGTDRVTTYPMQRVRP